MMIEILKFLAAVVLASVFWGAIDAYVAWKHRKGISVHSTYPNHR